LLRGGGGAGDRITLAEHAVNEEHCAQTKVQSANDEAPRRLDVLEA